MTGEQIPDRTSGTTGTTETAGITGTNELSERIVRLSAAQVRHGSELDALSVKVTGVNAWVGGLHGTMSEVSARLADLTGTVTELSEDVARSRDEFAVFLQQYERDRLASGAQAELARLTTDWLTRFGGRKRIRSLARGLTHTLTADAIRRDAVEPLIVKEALQDSLLWDSTYWLAPALTALAARHLGDPDTSERARQQAYALDPAKAKLFAALTFARLGEQDQAARWAGRYLETLDPKRLEAEFQPVLSAIAAGELGAEAHTFALQAMLRWDNDSETPEADRGAGRARGRHASDKRIAGSRPRALRWDQRLWDLRTPVSAERFPALREAIGDQWDGLAYGWELATIPGGLLGHLNREFPDTPEELAAGRGYAGLALEMLIERPETDEAELHREMQWQRRVVENRGENLAALAVPASPQPVLAEFAPGLDFAAILDHAVFEPERVELGAAGRRLALICVWKSVQQSAADFVRAAATQRPQQIHLDLHGWTIDVPTDPAVLIDEPLLADRLATHIDDLTREAVRAVTHNWLRLVAAGLGGALTTTLAVVLLRGNTAVSVAAGGAAVAVWGLLDLRRVPVQRRRRQDHGRRTRKESLRLLAAALRQRTEFFDTWDRSTAELTNLRMWSPFGNGPDSTPTTLSYEEDEESEE